MPLPESVRDENHFACAGPIFGGCERAAEHGLDPESPEEALRDFLTMEDCGLTGLGQRRI